MTTSSPGCQENPSSARSPTSLNWNNLAKIVFESRRPGPKARHQLAADPMRSVAQTGLDAGRPLLDSISDRWATGLPLHPDLLMFAWALVFLFILAIQLFVTLSSSDRCRSGVSYEAWSCKIELCCR